MRATVLLVAVVLVVGAGAPAVVAASSSGGSPQSADGAGAGALGAPGNETGNASANDTAPGAMFVGVVKMQGAQVEGEVEQRSFGLRIAAANSNAAKASVVASQSEELRERLAELQERKRALIRAKKNGSISQSRFRAEMAALAAEISTLQRLSNATVETAERLPADVLREHGVNVTALRTLRQHAANMTGPEIAAIARSIAGPPGNRTRGPPENVTRGPPGNKTAGPPGNKTVGPSGGLPGNATDGPGGAPGPDNRTTGPPTTTQGPTTTPGPNTTQGPPGNQTTGGPGGTGTTTSGSGTTTTNGGTTTPGGGPPERLSWVASGHRSFVVQ